MEITLPSDLKTQVEQEVSRGHYSGVDQLIEEAIRLLLEERRSSDDRIEALRRIGDAVDRAGLYENVHLPSQD